MLLVPKGCLLEQVEEEYQGEPRFTFQMGIKPVVSYGMF